MSLEPTSLSATDFIAEVCTELGVPFRVNGYRFWLEAAEPAIRLEKKSTP